MHGREIRQRLRSGDRVYGTHIVETGGPNPLMWEAEAELDFAFICTEHIPVDRKEVSWMCRMFSERGVSPMVRIPYPAAHWASMMIDGGAEGIVAPYVETCEQVEELIGAVRYRPIKGRFLQEIIGGTRTPTPKLQAFFERFSRDTYLIIGIESVPAIENLEKLLSYDEVDGVFLGPHDITCSMEIPEEYDNPAFRSLLREVTQTCRRLGKGVGLHCDYSEPENSRLVAGGMNFILDSADVMKGRNALLADFRKLRAEHGDQFESRPAPATSDQPRMSDVP